ncbi:DUF1631 family protein [Ramlibacter sp. AW1]|uniref:DUF1631 family protein n=1 Tax=Ramlibacter aurantiacus TaxID=2801330 RepID=A0A936ZFK5_9BURK|nr:DUF1631 family protein [Ramlibacter aurantiacus]MBL0420012.1 DUF1631 family protein [Ramlibacter aurantiacus]
MAKLLNLRWGVSDDPAALQPSLHQCLESLLAQCGLLAANVVEGLLLGSAPNSPRRNPLLQAPAVRRAIEVLQADIEPLRERFRAELTRLVYEGGGKDQLPADELRFEDLQLFDDEVLDQNIEQARARQEVERMVEDVLPALDALVSTLLGWRTAQPGLNPVRPEVFVRALQAALWAHVPDSRARDALVVPSAGLLGTQLRRLYREMADWLASTGVEPAVPLGGRKDGAAAGRSVSRSVAKTLLTLERLRKLLAGDFERAAPPGEFLHTVPASLALLQEMKQVDTLVQRLERERALAPPGAADPLGLETDSPDSPDAPRLGRQLGEQVVRLMFENLDQDTRLMPAYRQQLGALEPTVLALARRDSRFFSDREHAARRLLDRMTQRSLAFSSDADEGGPLFVAGVQGAVARLAERGAIVQGDDFGRELQALQADWDRHDAEARKRREEAARALMHAEQRNLLAQRLAAEFEPLLRVAGAPEFVGDFLRNAWPQALAEDTLRRGVASEEGALRAVAADLVWSVQPGPASGVRLQRLAYLVPGLLERLREGLRGIDYPPELAARFFERLGAIHASALQEGRNAAARRASEQAQEAPSEFGASAFDDSGIWLASREAQESGYVGPDRVPPAHTPPLQAAHGPDDLGQLLPLGAWVELQVQGRWERVQLSWASPHQTLFMFTSPRGSAHSMSRRTLDRLRAAGRIRVVADRHLVDQALDEVARAALRNTLTSPEAPAAGPLNSP